MSAKSKPEFPNLYIETQDWQTLASPSKEARQIAVYSEGSQPAEAHRFVPGWAYDRARISPAPAWKLAITDEMIDAAAEQIWNDLHARMAGDWKDRKPNEVIVIQLKATARAALEAAYASAGASVTTSVDQVCTMLEARAGYFDVTDGHFDREDAARSYRATSKEIRLALGA